MEFGPQQLGRWLIFIGLFTTLCGLILLVLGRFGLFKLPGDLEFGSKNWHFFLPLTTSIILSIILTLVFWIINSFRR
jgi:hypothetical protein